MTATTTGLLDALLAVQKAAPKLKKDETATVKSDKGSYKYSYVGLDSVVEAVRGLLADNGLVWCSLPGSDEHGKPTLTYRLAHAPTGEVIEGTMPLMLSKPDAQGFGSAITYARRYSLCAVLNLVADDDDDGHAAGGRGQASGSSDTPSDEQMKELGRQVKTNRPSTDVLREMLRVVAARGIDDEQIEDGSWATQITRGQVSKLLDIFKSGSLPTGKSDIPNDMEPAPPVEPDGDPLPFDAVGAEAEA